jgi:hypothetical protein
MCRISTTLHAQLPHNANVYIIRGSHFVLPSPPLLYLALLVGVGGFVYSMKDY